MHALHMFLQYPDHLSLLLNCTLQLSRNKDGVIVSAKTTYKVQAEIWCCKMLQLESSQNQNIQAHILKDVIEIYFKTLKDVYNKLLNQIIDDKGQAQYN